MSRPDLPVSLNHRAHRLALALIAEAPRLGASVRRPAGGETVVDCASPGSLELGLRLAGICLSDLASVSLVRRAPGMTAVSVSTGHPVLACLGSQYAGWHLRADDGSTLLASGPARALARREAILDDVPHEERASVAVLVLEGDAPPGDEAAEEVAQACALPRSALTFLHAPTGSLAGTVQVAARVVECAVQMARHLGFPLDRLLAAAGTAPLAPPNPDARAAMGRSNDAIIYGGEVHLTVSGPSEAARELAQALPSRRSSEWGRPFAEVWADAGGDFAKIDPGFFSPAIVAVTASETSETFHAGGTDPAMLARAVAAEAPDRPVS